MIRRLEWDSAHFGLRVGRVEAERLDRDAAAAVGAARHEFDCVYLLAAADDPETAEQAAQLGFRMVDVRVTFTRALDATLETVPAALEGRIRVAGTSDLPALEALAADSHGSTRFFFDRRFSRALVAELYRIWMRKELANPTARVFVVGDEGHPIGYTTCTLSEAEVTIGLVALAPSARGGGWGRALLLHALCWAAGRGATRATVVTQARNVKAQRLYERSGFVCHQTAVWYHLWPT